MEKLESPEKPSLSGAYIRSLVKKLSSTRNSGQDLDRDNINVNVINIPDEFPGKKQESMKPRQGPGKKQGRRRVHTSRPYKDRLLNMAEARREIVTALKLHRAAMRQKQQKQQSGPELSVQQPEPEQEAKMMKSSRSPRICAANSSSSDGFPVENFVYPPGFYSPYSWPVCSIASSSPAPFLHRNLDFALPGRALGLNLNLQDFQNLETASVYSGNNPSTSIYSSSSLSTSSSSTPGFSILPAVKFGPDSGLSTGIDEAAGISCDRPQFGPGTTSSFLKSIEIGPDDELVSSPFDEAMEIPAWLNEDDVNGSCCNGYYQDPALPCMDMEEIEGIDGDWLA